jgi:flagellar assembly protein FliH
VAGIIKADQRTHASASSAPRAFHFEDVGQSYVHRVRSEASKVIDEARREAAQIKARALEEGRQAAIKAVEESLRSRLNQKLVNALAAVEAAAREIVKSRQAWQQHWEKHVVELATAIAARLCRQELARSPEITMQWVREALELAAGSGQITLRLNPDDHAALEEELQPIAKAVSGLCPVHVVGDPSITPGGCRADTQFGSLDQQIEAQLARITEELLS